jgi:hypothetical protein
VERKPYQLDSIPRRKEWITLPAGEMCIWEMTCAEVAQMLERSQRPASFGGGQDEATAMFYEIMLSCYHGDEVGAAPVFPEMASVARLRWEDGVAIRAAVQRVNGKDASQEELMRGFSKAPEAQNTSESIPSA